MKPTDVSRQTSVGGPQTSVGSPQTSVSRQTSVFSRQTSVLLTLLLLGTAQGLTARLPSDDWRPASDDRRLASDDWRLKSDGWRLTSALSEAPRLAAVYDSILGAQFDRAETQLRDACPPAPAEACATLAAVSLWWQIAINPESQLLDQRFNDAAAKAIKAGEAWTKREPARAEAWFYLAGAHAPLAQWRVLRGERIAAARAGSRIKAALERALALDPDLADAHFGIGLYHYYADVAPAYAKVLRWLLLLPGGDRQLGLREMTTARQHGQLLAGEADFQLQQLYFWYEQEPREGLALLESLDARYPSNPLFLQRLAEADDAYFHDRRASASHWRELLARARDGRVYAAAISETRARLGLAAMQIELGEIAAAIDQLQIVIDARPAAPIGARARAESLLRAARERRNF